MNLAFLGISGYGPFRPSADSSESFDPAGGCSPINRLPSETEREDVAFATPGRTR